MKINKYGGKLDESGLQCRFENLKEVKISKEGKRRRTFLKLPVLETQRLTAVLELLRMQECTLFCERLCAKSGLQRVLQPDFPDPKINAAQTAATV